MGTESSPEREQPRPVYSTPAKSTIEVLEEMVSKPSDTFSSKSSRTLSPSNSLHTPSTGQTSHSKPLPPLSPSPSPPLVYADTPRASDKPLPHPLHDPKPPAPPVLVDAAMTSQSTFSLSPETTSASSSSHSKTPSKSPPHHVRSDGSKERRHRRHHSDPPSNTSPAPDAHAHHRRHRSSGSSPHSHSDSVSAVLALAAERLARETARANASERQASELLSMFKNEHEAKMKLERDLQRTKDELGLYKVQLDAAQAEIFRAQEIVDRVDRKRVEAEDELARTKEKMRRLSRDVAVEHALEEGRRLGFEEGLNQGRIFGPVGVEPDVSWEDVDFEKPKRRRGSSRKGDDDATSRVTMNVYPKTESGAGSPERMPHKLDQSHSHHHRHYTRTESVTTQSVYPQVSTYDPKPKTEPKSKPSHHQELYTNRPISPSPYEPPESTPDVAKYAQALPVPTITTPAPIRVPSTQPPVPPAMPPHSSDPPESIEVKPSDGQIHPVPVQNGSTFSHEAITVPPEGYIPFLDANSMISLPPPHELSYPVAAQAPERPKSGGSRPDSRPRFGNAYAPSTNSRPSKNADWESVAYTTRSSGRETARIETEGKRRAPSMPAYDRPPSATSTRHERPPSAMSARNDRPSSAASTRNDRPMSVASVRNTVGVGRRTREVILPIPMGDPFDDPTTANGNSARGRSATPVGKPYGRPTLGTDASFDSSSDNRSSTATIPVTIQVETPSTHTLSAPNSNRTTMVDPVLLTPDSANRPMALPPHTALGISTTQDANDEERIEMTLPDNNFPPGFVPLSPIPGMEKLNPYPPGFAPTLPRDHPSSGGGSGYTYGSPAMRPKA